MHAPRTEELLARIRRVCDEEEPAEGVVPLIEAAYRALKQTRNEFLRESQDDPEMPESAREKIGSALTEYLDLLLEMRESASELDLDALEAGLEETEKAVERVRSSQDEHKATLATGATLFPFLNRVLLQATAVRNGAGSARLLALLAEAPPFLKSLRTELERRGTSPMKSQTVFHLQQTLEALQTAIESGEPLPDREPEIANFASQLAGLLAEPPLENPEEGATPLPAVNQVLAALDGVKSDLEFLLALLDQCQDYLRSLLPVSSPPEQVERLNEVLETLDALRNWASEGGDAENKQALSADLISTATDLASILTDSQLGGLEQYSEFVEDLPPIFKSVLIHGYLYLDGQGSADNVYAASEHLYSSADEMLAQTEELSQDDPSRDSLREVVDLMREAADMLRDLAESANVQYLEIASSLCYQAAERLDQAVA